MQQPATTPNQEAPSKLQEVFDFMERFAGLLLSGQYAEARAQLTEDEQILWSTVALAHAWVRMVDTPHATRMISETIAVDAMDDWLEKRNGDMGWGYVPVVNEEVSEAISGVVVTTSHGPRLRALLFGKP